MVSPQIRPCRFPCVLSVIPARIAETAHGQEAPADLGKRLGQAGGADGGSGMKKYLLLAVISALTLIGLGSFAETALAAGPLIVLDPGHSGSTLNTIDPETQILDQEYLNTPETQNMFEVATILKGKLEAAGYRVLMTKQAWNDTVCKRDRVNVANDNNAALAVSLHTSGHIFGQYGQIYVQRMDSYRENINGQRVYFNLPDVAAASQKYGQIFLTERRKIEGSSIVLTVNDWWAGRGQPPGNIPIPQLFSKVPWIFCEAGVPQNSADKDGYAQSLFNSIIACVPLDYASPPIDTTPFRIRYDQIDKNLYFTGTWSTYTVSGSSGPSYKRTSTGSSSVTVKFTGTSFAWIATCGTTLGRAFVSLDGGPAEAVDLYRTSTTRQQNVWSVKFDTTGTHTVKIWRDPRNTSGKLISIDAVEVVGPVDSLLPAGTPPPPTAIRYDDTDQNLSYSGTWSPFIVTGSSGPGYQRTCSGSSSVTVRFKGTYFAWIATCGTTLGRAFVSLDGGPAQTVDLSRTSTKRQQNVWSVKFDTAETHTVKIWRDPTNMSSKYISIDALDLVGSLNPLLPTGTGT